MRRYGDRAFVVSPPDPAGVAAQARALPGVVDAVPGAHDLVVVCSTPDLEPIAAAVEALAPQAVPPDSGTVEVPVVYDGPDLAAVADLAGLGVEDVVARHSGGTYVVRLMGFAPGFGYLDGLDHALAAVARRPEPRGRVPVGAVALAGGWTGVYPVASPGGWHLLGTTNAVLFDVDRDPPSLLRPGLRVRFVPA